MSYVRRTLKGKIEQDNVRVDVVMTNKTPPKDYPAGSNAWRVTLKRKGRQLTVSFFTDPLAGEPDAEGVLDCLLSDASSAGQAYYDWLSDYGMEPDRENYATWQQIDAQTAKLRKFLGDDAFDAYRSAER